MSVLFYWFKEYNIGKCENPTLWIGSHYIAYINFIGEWGSTSFSTGNKRKINDLLNKVDCEIPSIPDEIFDDKPEKYVQNLLVNPSVMSNKCKELLNSKLNLCGMDNRMTWIKNLSDNGHYVAYEKL